MAAGHDKPAARISPPSAAPSDGSHPRARHRWATSLGPVVKLSRLEQPRKRPRPPGQPPTGHRRLHPGHSPQSRLSPPLREPGRGPPTKSPLRPGRRQFHTRAIEPDPKLARAYYNRALACFLKRGYQNALADMPMAQAPGYKVNPAFLVDLRRASTRHQ